MELDVTIIAADQTEGLCNLVPNQMENWHP